MAVNVNGHEYAFTSIRTTFGSFRPNALKSISYSETLEPGIVEADSPFPVGMTRGKASCEASISFATRRAYQEWIEDMISQGQSPFETFFTITCVYSETNVSPVLTDTIMNCRLRSASIDASGTDAVEVSCELSVLGDGKGFILWNGKRHFAE
jgi:hypothetical protein